MTDSPDSEQWWTDDRRVIREWAAERGLEPVAIERADGDTEVRLEPDPEDTSGDAIPWPEFFDYLDADDQVVLYRGQAATEGAGSDHPWEVIDRRGVPERVEAIEKTQEPPEADADQLAVSDTGEGEPVAFDQTEDEPTTPADQTARTREPPSTDRTDDPSNAATRDRTREFDATDALVLDTVHERRRGPDVGPLGDEHVTLRNDGDGSLDLSGWRLRNEAGASYRIPDGTTLAPGERLTVHTGEGDEQATGTTTALFWDAGESVWPHDGETVIVETDTGERVLEAPYKGGREGKG